MHRFFSYLIIFAVKPSSKFLIQVLHSSVLNLFVLSISWCILILFIHRYLEVIEPSFSKYFGSFCRLLINLHSFSVIFGGFFCSFVWGTLFCFVYGCALLFCVRIHAFWEVFFLPAYNEASIGRRSSPNWKIWTFLKSFMWIIFLKFLCVNFQLVMFSQFTFPGACNISHSACLSAVLQAFYSSHRHWFLLLLFSVASRCLELTGLWVFWVGRTVYWAKGRGSLQESHAGTSQRLCPSCSFLDAFL